MLNPLVLGLMALAAPGTGQATRPLACRANALDKAERQRQQALLNRVRESAIAKRELPDGLALALPADAGLFREVAEWIGLERRCCPFLEFVLEWRGDDAVAVRMTGPPGVKDVIAAEMGMAAER